MNAACSCCLQGGSCLFAPMLALPIGNPLPALLGPLGIPNETAENGEGGALDALVIHLSIRIEAGDEREHLRGLSDRLRTLDYMATMLLLELRRERGRGAWFGALLNRLREDAGEGGYEAIYTVFNRVLLDPSVPVMQSV